MSEPSAKPMLDIEQIRADFPILSQEVGGNPLVYLDNAATTQKPNKVINRLMDFYQKENANIHRGLHTLSERATEAYEGARVNVSRFLKAKESKEIVFVRSTTEAINLVAQTYVAPYLEPGDEILISELEHHSNIVPWQMIAQKANATIRVVPLLEDGSLNMEEFDSMLTEKVKFFAISHMSNALGTINPIKEMIAKAHANDIPVLVDGAQAVAHMNVDVQDLDCDFYVFSGHKVFGPTGIGVLYGKAEHLDAMVPYQGGGEMITMVSFEQTDYQAPPHRFEAGTPNIAGAIGLDAALHYVQRIGFDAIGAYEQSLMEHAEAQAKDIEGLIRIGQAPNRASIFSFKLNEVHAHDVGTVLNSRGVAIRAGHHCAMPVMEHFQVPATTRISFCFYNTKEELSHAFATIKEVKKVFG